MLLYQSIARLQNDQSPAPSVARFSLGALLQERAPYLFVMFISQPLRFVRGVGSSSAHSPQPQPRGRAEERGRVGIVSLSR